MRTARAASGRLVLVLALALAAWGLAKYATPWVPIEPITAPANMFSALRAAKMEAELLGPQLPHPASTPANAAIHQRLLAQLAALHIPAHPYTAMGCIDEHHTAVTCAIVTDIVAEVVPGPGKAIAMMAHLDSVPAGPGAADDGSGVATVLETARALRASGGDPLHPVLAIFTDGEEYGLLGAKALLDNPALRGRVGPVINMEARGNQGPSRMFQTSAKASKLIDLYAGNVPAYATSSLYAEIYKALPNDTDLTPFLADGYTGINFAFIDRLAHYHTARDTLANLSRESLQQHGANLLGMVRALMRTPYAELAGHDEIYVDLYGRWLPRLPQSWALPLALLEGLIVVIAALALSAGASLGAWLRAGLIVPGMLVLAGLIGWLAVLIAQTLSGMPEPAYAHPVALRLALAFSVLVALLLCMRLAPARAAVAGVWIWLAGLGIVVAWRLPGFSPYFLLPLAVAAPLLVLTAAAGPKSAAGQVALFLAAAAMVIVWMPLVASGEAIMGLKLHPLVTLPAALALAAAVPFLTLTPLTGARWRGFWGAALGFAAVAAICAGLQPAYSRQFPQRLNLTYLVDGTARRSQFAADATAPLPAALRQAADFSVRPQAFVPSLWGGVMPAYVASAPAYRGPMPAAQVLSDQMVKGRRRLVLRLSGAPDPMAMVLHVPRAAGLWAVTMGEKTMVLQRRPSRMGEDVLACMSSACAAITITLDLAVRGPLQLDLLEWQKHLPAQAAPLLAARPDQAVESQNGDGTVLRVPLAIPAVQERPRLAPGLDGHS